MIYGKTLSIESKRSRRSGGKTEGKILSLLKSEKFSKSFLPHARKIKYS